MTTRLDPRSVRASTLSRLTRQQGLAVERREEIRVWSMSGVERLHLAGGRSAILKYAVPEFAAEPDVLRHAAAHAVPVPAVVADTTQPDGSLVMIMEDLGPQTCQADLADAAQAAAAIHRCPPMPGRAILDERGLAALPSRSLGWLWALQAEGRWTQFDLAEIEDGLCDLTEAARALAKGADIPPFGMCHSEFHPTSVHIGGQGLRILDWARAFTGPGLLDLVSWQGTPEPLNLSAVADLIDAYVSAGGPQSAHARRGGLSAAVWASGWFKLWAIEWWLENTFRRGDPDNDAAVEKAIRRHLNEATQCLLG